MKAHPPWLVVVAILASGQAPAPLELDIAVNGAVTVQHMSRQSVAEVFLLKRQFWANREPIVIIIQGGDGPLQTAFCAKILETSCDAMDQAELEKRYQNNLFVRVVRATSSADAMQLLQRYPTALAYFRRGTAPAGARVVLQP